MRPACTRSEEHTSELQSRSDLVCRLLLEKKKDDFPAATTNRVIGNLIGTNITATSALNNGCAGVRLTGNSNSIGGTLTGQGNTISGNGTQGIVIGGAGNW